MIRGGTSAKVFVYGVSWLSGNVVYWRPAQSKADPYAWLVMALPIAHPIDFIEAVTWGEHVLTLDADGYPAPGPFNKTWTNSKTQTGVTNGGDVLLEVWPADAPQPWTIIPGSITCALTRSEWVQVSNDEGTYQSRTESIPDCLVTIRPDGRTVFIHAAPGYHFTLSFRYQFTKRFLKVYRYSGDENQEANAELIAATAGLPRPWTAQHRLRGVPYVIVRILPDAEVFPREVENITCRVRGKKDVLDTRTGQIGFSQNPMMCARDYAVARCNVHPASINLPLLNAHANICDEQIVEPNIFVPGQNVVSRRWACNIALSTERIAKDNLGELLATCDGSAVMSGSSFDIRCGAWEAPAVYFNDSDIVSSPEVSKSPPRMDLFNAVRGTYRNGAKPFWPVEEAPGYESAHYRQQDGGIFIPREMEFAGVLNVYQLQRLMKQTLFKARSGMRMRVRVTMKGVTVSPEGTVAFTLLPFGFVGKTWRVKSVQPIYADVYELELQEDGPGNYVWSLNEAITDPTPNTSLPSIRDVPSLGPLTLITNETAAAFGQEGDLQAMCHVTWAPVTNALVLSGGYIQIRYKRSFDTVWTESPRLLPESTDFRFPIRRNDMIMVEARCGNAFVPGPWSTAKKFADDAPTPYAIGNWLHNPQLEFDKQFTPPPWTPPFAWAGWTFPSMTDDNFGTGAPSVPASAEPFYQFGGQPTGGAGGFSAANVQFVLQQVQAIPVVNQYLWGWSARIPCPPAGSRVCGFVEAWTNTTGGDGHIFLVVVFFDADEMFMQEFPGEAKLEGVDIGPGALEPQDMRDLMMFCKVPAGAVTMSLAWVHRRTAVSTSGSTIMVVGHPYLGPASEGQITKPKWSK
jgi:hypothetical protein